MTTMPMIDPAMASAGSAEVEMRARQRQIEENRRNINAGNQKTKEEKLRESCEGFEAMFIQKMWEGMRASLPQDGMMQSRDEKHWQGMYDQELGKSMAKAGGIGLADMMMSQMSRNLKDASEVAAGSSSRRRPMDIAPAPLLVEQPAAPKNPAPVVAAQAVIPATAGAAAATDANKTTVAAKAAQGAEPGKPGMDLYSNASAVAPSPEDPATAPAGGTGSVATAAATPSAPSPNTPPEVQSALTSLATMTTQAEAARGVGQQTVNHINGQQPQVVTPGQAPAGKAAPATPAAPQGTSPVAAAATPATPQGSTPTASAYPQGVNPASVNAPPPDLPTFAPRQPINTAAYVPGKAPNNDVQHITRTQRQSARVSQTPRAQRTAATPPLESGADFANNSVSRSPAPFTGQNMPVSPVGDVATELLKSQLGEPTVKTKL